MKSLTIDGIEVIYNFIEEPEEWFDKNGDPGTPGSVDVEIISPVEFIGDDNIIWEIIKHEKG